jgi:predicted MFS family arabinose efflux permease
MRHILFGVIVGVVVLVGNIVLDHMDLPHTFWVQALVCGFAGLIASLVYHRQTSRTD